MILLIIFDRFFMLCKLTNSPAQAAFLLSESSKSKDLLDMNNEVAILFG
jgi:hypothetical protein